MQNTFSERVIELALSIPEGRVTTYGDLAKAAGGGAMAARSVSSILGKYPNQKAVPWHRIVYANGRVWFGSGCEPERRKRFKREGVGINEKGYVVDFEELRFDFTELY